MSPKKVGRPKGPLKVVLKKRLVPDLEKACRDMIDLVEDGKITPSRAIDILVHGISDPIPLPPVVEAMLQSGASNTIALLDDIEKLTNDIEILKSKLDRCARSTDDEKARRWIFLYDGLIAKIREKHPDEGW